MSPSDISTHHVGRMTETGLQQQISVCRCRGLYSRGQGRLRARELWFVGAGRASSQRNPDCDPESGTFSRWTTFFLFAFVSSSSRDSVSRKRGGQIGRKGNGEAAEKRLKQTNLRNRIFSCVKNLSQNDYKRLLVMFFILRALTFSYMRTFFLRSLASLLCFPQPLALWSGAANSARFCVSGCSPSPFLSRRDDVERERAEQVAQKLTKTRSREKDGGGGHKGLCYAMPQGAFSALNVRNRKRSIKRFSHRKERKPTTQIRGWKNDELNLL